MKKKPSRNRQAHRKKSMSRRVPILKDIVADVLTKCRRRCCICHGLHGDLSEKQGQIAHLDRDPSNHALDNLAYLCLSHHDRYDSDTSQSKRFSMQEVKIYRKALWHALEDGLHNKDASYS
jgi:hypothetical protein